MHEIFMQAALDEARLYRGACAPNPPVGAVAVKDNAIIARASHRGVGTPHAEILLLEQLAGCLKDVSVYVSLEPCNHWGKTPPCVEALISRGVGRVIYGYADPNPLVSKNDTPAILKAAGIEVEHYPMRIIDRFYKSYSYFIAHKKPFLTGKIAQSLDGKIAQADGKPTVITNALCAEFTHWNRRCSDAILTTARTIEADNPRFTARCADGECSKVLVIIDSNLRLTGKEKALKQAKALHIFHDARYSAPSDVKQCHYYAVQRKENGLDLSEIIDKLGELGFHDVWVEAGGQLFSNLHCQGLLQRAYIYIAPLVLGAEAPSAFPSHAPMQWDASVSWKTMGDNIIGRLDWVG